MNKKLNTVFFILGATVFNVIVAVLSFIILTALFARFLMPALPETGMQWSFTLIFLASIAISFFTYRAALKFLMKKIEIEKYFDPLFVSRYKKK